METLLAAGGSPLPALFKSHHSGMETLTRQRERDEQERFKSHHSGMETSAPHRVEAAVHRFKSHHSGMETLLRCLLDKGLQTLNRTIVGWKRILAGPTPRTSRPFKSHHSGMETASDRLTTGRSGGFKSHHSGMETELFTPF